MEAEERLLMAVLVVVLIDSARHRGLTSEGDEAIRDPESFSRKT